MADWDVRGEVVRLLQALLRLDTVNPPGNETAAAELLRDYLEGHGVQCRLLAREPHRANLVARIAGADPEAPRLLLLSHTDTVIADPGEWSIDPWSGALLDDQVWGRGALDMKNQVAASAVAMATLARDGFAPSGDLVFVASADEEVGEDFGVSWLCREHPEAIRAAWCINEGSGDRIEVAGRVLYLVSTAEKATAPLTLRVRGKSGHASAPGLSDNALLRAAALLERLGRFQQTQRLEPETRGFLSSVLGAVGEPSDALAELRAVSESAARMLEPMLTATLAPTQITSSPARNVIPGECEVGCDCRLLPGQGVSEVEAAVRSALGVDGYELEWQLVTGGSRSSLDTPLWDVIEGFVAGVEPGARLAPILLAGFTDSHYLREAFGTVAYGFFPMRTMDPQLAATLIHSADERTHVDDLVLGTSFLVHAAQELLA